MKDVRTAADLARPLAGAARGRLDRATFVTHALSERLLWMAKFAEIGQLATGLIHEINNPAACLHSNVAILLTHFPGPTATLPEVGTGTARRGTAVIRSATRLKRSQEVREILEDLLISADLVTSLSRNLKSLAYSVHDAPKETDLHECIEAALSVSGHELKYRVRVEKDFGTLPRLVAYPGLLIQVFLNLFVNAAQAIEGAGVLRIRTRPDGDGVIVEVSDTGRGIAPEVLPKIFRPFFTTKPLGSGLGLGLSICKRTIDHHGGTLDVSSAPGQGTMFRAWLPRVAGRPQPGPGRLPGSWRPRVGTARGALVTSSANANRRRGLRHLAEFTEGAARPTIATARLQAAHNLLLVTERRAHGHRA